MNVTCEGIQTLSDRRFEVNMDGELRDWAPGAIFARIPPANVTFTKAYYCPGGAYFCTSHSLAYIGKGLLY